MTTSLEQIEEQILALSAADRAKLVASLMASSRSPPADAKKALSEWIKKRMAAIERGEISDYPDASVFADVRRLSRQSG